MSIRVMSEVWSKSTATGGDLLVLLYLANVAHDDGTSIYPSVETIAKHARLSERATRYCLRRLEKSGVLEAVGKGPRKTTLYRINTAKLGEEVIEQDDDERGQPVAGGNICRGQNATAKVSQIAPNTLEEPLLATPYVVASADPEKMEDDSAITPWAIWTWWNHKVGMQPGKLPKAEAGIAKSLIDSYGITSTAELDRLWEWMKADPWYGTKGIDLTLMMRAVKQWRSHEATATSDVRSPGQGLWDRHGGRI